MALAADLIYTLLTAFLYLSAALVFRNPGASSSVRWVETIGLPGYLAMLGAVFLLLCGIRAVTGWLRGLAAGRTCCVTGFPFQPAGMRRRSPESARSVEQTFAPGPVQWRDRLECASLFAGVPHQ